MPSSRPLRLLAAATLALAPLGVPLAAPGVSPAASAAEPDPDARVLAISIDGLNPDALKKLGSDGVPTIRRLMREGASTSNARTARELTATLPNHTTMLTGRRVDASRGGHGVTWNDERRGSTVQKAAGGPVWSIYSRVQQADRSGAMFAGKDKFRTFKRSWSKGIDRFVYSTDPLALVKSARQDLKKKDRAFTFLHLALPDQAGHQHGWMSKPYLQAVRRSDQLLAKILRAVDNTPELGEELTILLTADHGGKGPSHLDARRYANYRVPFVAWGRGVSAGSLYTMNKKQYRGPGTRRTTYAGRQPVRNGDLANLAADLLGLDPLPKSTINASQQLKVN